MKLQKIYLKNYRNYDDILLELNNNLNIIIGDNAQGKTNLLESIYVLAVTKSFLSISDKNLINFNSKYSMIKGIVDYNGSYDELELLINENGKVVKINKRYDNVIDVLTGFSKTFNKGINENKDID